jgi:MFS family permease
MVMRFGIRTPLAAGLMTAAAGLALFAFAPVGGNFLVHVLPGMLLLGLGAGMAFNPVLLAAMSDAAPQESGLASGVVNTSFMMGGALGLAVLASLAASRTDSLRASGDGPLAALTGGYHVAFIGSAIFSALAALLAGTLLRVEQPAHAAHGAPALAETD